MNQQKLAENYFDHVLYDTPSPLKCWSIFPQKM